MTDEPVYGYQLQAPDGRWQVRETRADGTLYLSWFEQWLDEHANLDPERRNLRTAGTWRLLATVGFLATADDLDLDDPDRFDEWLVADEEIGVRLVSSGAGLLLVDSGLGVSSSGAGADEKLRSALTVLGLTPLQEQPAWYPAATQY